MVFLCGIDLVNVIMELICEFNGLKGDVIGGCFFDNGDIVLVY